MTNSISPARFSIAKMTVANLLTGVDIQQEACVTDRDRDRDRDRGEIGAEQLVERLTMPFGKAPHPHQRTLIAHNREDRHQKQPPLRTADVPTRPASGNVLKTVIRSIVAAGMVTVFQSVLAWAKHGGSHNHGALTQQSSPKPCAGDVGETECRCPEQTLRFASLSAKSRGVLAIPPSMSGDSENWSGGDTKTGPPRGA